MCDGWACVQLGIAKLPAEIPDGATDDEAFLRSVHSLVLDVRARRCLTALVPCGACHLCCYVTGRGVPAPADHARSAPNPASTASASRLQPWLQRLTFVHSSRPCHPQVHINEGKLVCPNCGRAYNITEGIPNMLLHEDEV